jgi:hypothetical protein
VISSDIALLPEKQTSSPQILTPCRGSFSTKLSKEVSALQTQNDVGLSDPVVQRLSTEFSEL